MNTPQSGIFALGTASHAYLEFDASAAARAGELVRAVASLREPRTTMGGVNLVAGFRPELWREVVPERRARELDGFNATSSVPDGYTMPATQHDAVLWLSGSAYDVVFDTARAAIAALEPARVGRRGDVQLAVPARPRPDRLHRRQREPDLIDAPEVALIPEGSPAPAARSCSSRSGATTRARGSRWPSPSRSRSSAAQGRERRARRQARRLARRQHRPGRLRQDLPPQHALRNGDRPRDDVRRLQRRAAAAGDDAREHGRADGGTGTRSRGTRSR